MKIDARTFVVLNFLTVVFVGLASAEKPCAARAIKDRSPVCVCNETYCDEIVRQKPAEGSYVSYTSSEGGLRFNKKSANLEEISSSRCCDTNFVLDPSTRYQTIEGFGGAVTDAAGINWKNLSVTLQNHLINSYYGDNGIQYNMFRTPIGGCDFSTHPYAYNELPENDVKLTNFTLAPEDLDYKLPMIKSIFATSSTPVNIVATTWSPPKWMKTNNAWSGFSSLKNEYYQSYADYHLKFLQEYAAQGVKIWAITTTNEPVNGVVPLARFNSLGWSPNHMGEWISNNLGPTIRNSTFKDVKILGLDDQRFTIPIWFDVMIKQQPKALEYIDGVAVHYYGDIISPASLLSHIPKSYPGKFVIATEACEGSYPWETEKVALGLWSRAKSYISDIITDLNYDVVGWLDWNLCLNSQGGPNWAENYVDSPIIVFPENGEFIKQPMFYAMGHFSKFVPRGSVRIKITENKPLLKLSIENVAFVTPDNTVVAVLQNSHSKSRQVAVRLGSKQANIELPAHSVTTVELTKTN